MLGKQIEDFGVLENHSARICNRRDALWIIYSAPNLTQLRVAPQPQLNQASDKNKAIPQSHLPVKVNTENRHSSLTKGQMCYS